MGMMRVLHWVPNYFNGGSIANVVLRLAGNQSRLGATVTIAAVRLPDPPSYEPMSTDERVPVIEWRPRWIVRVGPFLLRGVPDDAVRHLREFAPHLVHVHGEFTGDNLWVPRLFDCPIALSPHGAFYPEVFVKSHRTAKRLYFGAARRLLYSRVSAFHALSWREAEHIARLLPNSRVYCVPNGAESWTQERGERCTLQRRDGSFVFMFIGRLDVFAKGLDILLEAFAEVRRTVLEHPPLLVLVGPDRQGGEAWLRRRARELHIADCVTFTGRLSRRQLASILDEADVYVQLSRHDAFPLTVADALIAGKPTIMSTEVGHASYREIASLPHVRIVPPDAKEAASALVDFAGRIGELRTVAQQQQPVVREFFSWDRAAAMQLEMYRDIARGAVA